MPFVEGEIWHFEGRQYRLTGVGIASYPRHKIEKVKGKNVRVELPALEYSICLAVPIGDDAHGVPVGLPAKKPRAPKQKKLG